MQYWYKNFIRSYVHLQSQMILMVIICTLSGRELQAAPENSIFTQEFENANSQADLSAPITSVAELENSIADVRTKVNSVGEQDNFYQNFNNSYEGSSVPLYHQLEQQQFLIAAPENFNPGLRTPPVPPPQPPKPPDVSIPRASVLQWPVPQDLKIDFRDDYDNYGQHNQIVEPTIRFRSPNGQIIPFKFGYNTFDQVNYETIYNIPFQVGWQGKLGRFNVQASGGVDIFNRLPTAVNLNLQADTSVFVNVSSKGQLESGLFVTGIVEQGLYKFNAQTLENKISAWRFGPNVYWQINRNTSFFSLYRHGEYNDGNTEHQTFSRLERKIGQFFVAANLFTWSYEKSVSETKGYFSPPDFLVYNGEVGWEGDVSKFLRCRVSGNFGQQRLNGQYDFASTYQGRCTVKVTPNLETDFGYAFSNVRNRQTGDESYNNRTVTSQLRYRF